MSFRWAIFSSFLLGVLVLPFSGCSGRPSSVEMPKKESVPDEPKDRKNAQKFVAPPVELPKK